MRGRKSQKDAGGWNWEQAGGGQNTDGTRKRFTSELVPGMTLEFGGSGNGIKETGSIVGTGEGPKGSSQSGWVRAGRTDTKMKLVCYETQRKKEGRRRGEKIGKG